MSINAVAVDSALEQFAIRGMSRFNAYYVAHLSNQDDVDKVNEYLLFKAHFGALHVKIEVLCPNNHPDLAFNLTDPLPLHSIECRICDTEYIPALSRTNIVYYFDQSFVEEVKKKPLHQTKPDLAPPFKDYRVNPSIL